MRSCSAKLEPVHGLSLEIGHIALPDDQPRMSAETWKWLLERKDRVNEWAKYRDTWENNRLWRVESCTTIQLAQQPFIITGSRSAIEMHAEKAIADIFLAHESARCASMGIVQLAESSTSGKTWRGMDGRELC